MKKSLIAILMTAVFLTSIVGPLVYNNITANAAVAPDPTNWYQTVSGVLATDSYSLYPYNQSSLKIGLSKFGEFIDNNTNVGLEYAGAVDPWAAPAGSGIDPFGILPKKVWINGWFLDITYNHSSWGLRNLWAGALYADLSSYTKPWLKVSSEMGTPTYEWQESFLKPGYEIAPNGTVIGTTPMYGGRKTNGTATTEPIAVLYHGPREYVARIVNHIWDVDEVTNDSLHIVDVIFTVIFNKVKKEIVVLKDVKVVDQAKYQISALKVTTPVWISEPTTEYPNGHQELQYIDVPFGILCQFSNREEWDMGTPTMTPKYASYAHFYTEGTAINDTLVEGQETVYNGYYTALTTLPANTSVVGGYTNTSAHGPEPYQYEHEPSTYDVAQIISNDKKYVGFAGYWPSLSDWSIDAGGGRRNLWYRAILGTDAHDIDSFANPNDEPFVSPLTVGEWDFMLSDDARIAGPIRTNVQFRGVSVYGVTDLHDGSDENFKPYNPSNTNTIDREVRYQLDEVFNPWDLVQALYKDTMRWVQKEDGDGTTKDFMLEYTYEYPARPNIDNSWPYVDASDFMGSQGWWNTTANAWNVTWTPWDSYNYYDTEDLSYETPAAYEPVHSSFPERVLINGTLQKRDIDYILWTNTTNTLGTDENLHYSYDGLMWINFTHAPGPHDLIKILFSTSKYWQCSGAGYTNGYSHGYNGAWEWGIVGRDSATIDSVGLGMTTEWASNNGAPVTNTGFDMQDTLIPGSPVPYTLTQQRPELLPGKAGYRDASQAFNAGRLALKDDWCMHRNATDGTWINGVPVASSNIIAVGGPSANLMSEYFNDFTTTFATLAPWTPDPNNAGKIIPLTCWASNHNDTTGAFHAYTPEYNATGVQDIGYGVIATYKDINGTVGLTIWGYTGQDTYFTSWAMLHSDVLALAFDLMPPGVTSLVLRFNYTLHPTDYCFVTIVEALGTISEYDAQACFGVGPFVTDPVMMPAFEMCYGWPEYPQWVLDKYPTIHRDP